MKKILAIGLDGASFTVLKPWMEEGILPNFKKVVAGGVSGELMSTIPPVTGPAWASFMTGKAPGSHGIYDFVKPIKGGIGREIVNYKSIKSETIFSLLTRHGKKIISINMPLTYPMPEVDGYIISGLLTPKTSNNFTYPPSLLNELQTEIGEYVIDVRWQRYEEYEIEKFLKRLIFCTEQRIKTFFYLMKRFDWDFFMAVFIGTDRIQHFLWDYIFTDSRQNDKRARKIRNLIIDYYKLLDSFIGRCIGTIDSNTFFIIMSDHGFGPLKGKVYINNWLEKSGCLSFNHEKVKALRTGTGYRSSLKKLIKKIDRFDIAGNIIRKFTKGTKRMSAYEFLNCIDWSKTKAYAGSNTEQGIYINLIGREPYGTVHPNEHEKTRDELIKKLSTLCHPVTGERLLSHVFKREDIYSGPYLDNAPDIIFFLSNGEYLADVQPADKLFEEKHWRMGSGTHRSEGIFIAYGTDINNGIRINNARIIDLAPTLLNMLDLPIPDDMEGRVLSEIFKNDFLQSNPPRYQSGGKFIGIPDRVYTNDEAAEVEERLRGLGYI
jgi:predicted AlkP superfamily phosphohydrolase/phosphomutase